jgi:hypothetical protein
MGLLSFDNDFASSNCPSAFPFNSSFVKEGSFLLISVPAAWTTRPPSRGKEGEGKGGRSGYGKRGWPNSRCASVQSSSPSLVVPVVSALAGTVTQKHSARTGKCTGRRRGGEQRECDGVGLPAPHTEMSNVSSNSASPLRTREQPSKATGPACLVPPEPGPPH